MEKLSVNSYHSSIQKILLNYGLIILFFPVLIVLFPTISILVIVASGLPVLFIQDRVGKNGEVFRMIKFRTMVKDAERLKAKCLKLNEADGPVFKIKNDPRYTRIGKILSRTGLDELPQIINVIKGEMSLIGPRPLPITEAKKLTKEQNIRLNVLPGITSTWIANGHHKHTFNTWMSLDKEYVHNGTLLTDIEVLIRTIKIPTGYLKDKLKT